MGVPYTLLRCKDMLLLTYYQYLHYYLKHFGLHVLVIYVVLTDKFFVTLTTSKLNVRISRSILSQCCGEMYFGCTEPALHHSE